MLRGRDAVFKEFIVNYSNMLIFNEVPGIGHMCSKRLVCAPPEVEPDLQALWCFGPEEHVQTPPPSPGQPALKEA